MIRCHSGARASTPFMMTGRGVSSPSCNVCVTTIRDLGTPILGILQGPRTRIGPNTNEVIPQSCRHVPWWESAEPCIAPGEM
ncbi:hypothetical protein GDO81_026400 [Engystomops pustulosus]|uniref:Uncharacterized protein n=1 Tax=Engystomops pustulosus TaxID=76066 RepID=A0AAV6YHC0_ENGPU|nr:hypothetical protein GDO81_026400 [Engystomops pustulosus]